MLNWAELDQTSLGIHYCQHINSHRSKLNNLRNDTP
jgi:hypothetical protein